MTEITNRHRAAWAAAGLRGYCQAKEGAYEPYDTAEYILSDLLTDLMHYTAGEGIDFMRCVERAAGHHAAEEQEETASPPADNALAPIGPLPGVQPSALARLIETIEATGGLILREDGRLYPAADEDWADLADAYLAACAETGRAPLFTPTEHSAAQAEEE